MPTIALCLSCFSLGFAICNLMWIKREQRKADK